MMGAPLSPALTLAELVDYLARAGVEPTRLAVAALATDQGLDDERVAEILAELDGGAQ